jgi:hypothetical protein
MPIAGYKGVGLQSRRVGARTLLRAERSVSFPAPRRDLRVLS